MYSYHQRNHKSNMSIGELALLRNDTSEQASPMTEGVVEIGIDIHLARE
jgi:hypothetical protein